MYDSYDEKGMTKIAGGLNRSAVAMFVLRNFGARIVENAFGNMRIVFGRRDEDSRTPCQLAIHAGKIELHHHGLHQNQWWNWRCRGVVTIGRRWEKKRRDVAGCRDRAGDECRWFAVPVFFGPGRGGLGRRRGEKNFRPCIFAPTGDGL
jgi:hypothetical protein